MKYSLLEIVQEILNDMDSDFVNGIDDTVESQQVAQIVKSCFNEMMSNRNWPHLKQLIQLEASGTILKPTHMKLPQGIKELSWVRYDKRKVGDTRLRYEPVSYLDPDKFLELTHARNLDNDNVIMVSDFSSTPIVIFNHLAPQFYTSFDDEWLVFDSYDASVDDTLKQSKSQVQVYKEPSWTHLDTFVPDLPEEAFAALIEEAKSTASLSLKQIPNSKAEQKASRQNRWLARKAWKAHGGLEYEDYGRKGRRRG